MKRVCQMRDGGPQVNGEHCRGAVEGEGTDNAARGHILGRRCVGLNHISLEEAFLCYIPNSKFTTK